MRACLSHPAPNHNLKKINTLKTNEKTTICDKKMVIFQTAKRFCARSILTDVLLTYTFYANFFNAYFLFSAKLLISRFSYKKN